MAYIFKRISNFKVLILSVFLTLSGLQAKSAHYRASIVYCGIGSEIYAIFGHAGIRISTPTSDLVYNFGTFDPGTPEFISKYIKGNLDYFLSMGSFADFVEGYRQDGRTVSEYPLNLNDLQVQTLENTLQNTYNSHRGAYHYQFLKDNCSTRLYVLLKKILGRQMQTSQIPSSSTYRESLNQILEKNSLLRLPVNCLLGNIGEAKMTAEDKTYLPDSLVRQLKTSYIKDTAGTNVSMLSSNRQVITAQHANNFPYWDYVIAISVVMLILLIRRRWLLIPIAFAGILLISLSLYSDRIEFAWNASLLLFWPFDLLLFFVKWKYTNLFIKASILSNLVYISIYYLNGIHYMPLLVLAAGMIILKIMLISRSDSQCGEFYPLPNF